jgi:pyruvate dehydrogenase E2 component (dihydrolipoamide acetyltransferase)
MSEITQGTITVSSLGETGVDALFGVIYPPQVALVGFGAHARSRWSRATSSSRACA